MLRLIFSVYIFLYIFQNFANASDIPIIVIAPSKTSQSYSTFVS